MVSPAWSAATIQSPAIAALTVLPLTEQMEEVMELKLTGSPEVAVALAVVVPPTANVVGLTLIVPIVCLPLSTVMD